MKKYLGAFLIMAFVFAAVVIAVLTRYADTPGEVKASNQKKAQEKIGITFKVISVPPPGSKSRTMALENIDNRSYQMFEPCTEVQKKLRLGDVIKFTYREMAFVRSDDMIAQPNCHLSTEILNISEKDKNLRDESEELRQKGSEAIQNLQE